MTPALIQFCSRILSSIFFCSSSALSCSSSIFSPVLEEILRRQWWGEAGEQGGEAIGEEESGACSVFLKQ